MTFALGRTRLPQCLLASTFQFEFPLGLPKVHEHDGKRPQGFGLVYKGRLVCFYTYECDLGNGWEDYGAYAGDAQETRIKALKMGANLVQYVLTQ